MLGLCDALAGNEGQGLLFFVSLFSLYVLSGLE